MKKYLFSIVFIYSVVFNANISMSQDRTVQGVVTTFDSIPLIGVSVKAKLSKQSVLTDSTGNFSIVCSPMDKLKFSAKGFVSQRVKLEEKTRLIMVNLKLKPSPKSKELAIGYGHVRESEKLYSVSSLHDGDNVDFSIYTDMYDLIRGRLPGVKIENGEIIIRGRSSFVSSSAALIVLDGMIVDTNMLELLSPKDVKSIDVLKDGSAAIYGSRGANGVVLIETKRGGEDYDAR